ncbi:MAG: hypothetical protein ABID38_05810 [Candidatus Diapherotrites archaeon]
MKWLITIAIVSLILLGGCVTTDSDNQPITDISQEQNPKTDNQEIGTQNAPDTIVKDLAPKPDWIYGLIAYTDTCGGKDCIRFYFSFLDASKNEISTNGTALVEIEDKEGKKVYSNSFNVKKSDFFDTTIGITQIERLIWAGEIFEEEIEKSTAGSTGTLYLTFETDSGITFEKIETSLFGIPEKSKEELQEIYEELYQKSAVTIDKSDQKGYFLITIKQIGWFTGKAYSFGDEETKLRLDLEVTNITDKERYFFPSSIVFIDNLKNQSKADYFSSYSGAIESGEIYPGITKRGFILLENVSEEVTSGTVYFDCGYQQGSYDEVKCTIAIQILKQN